MIDQRRNDCGKGGADNDSYGEVDDIPSHNEGLKILDETHDS
jgi:hypothetical protein